MTVTGTRQKIAGIGMASALAIAGTLMTAAPAKTHPHIWIDAAATLVFEQGALTSVEVQWTLDPFVSALLIQDFDTDKDGMFGPEEAEALKQSTFVGLSEFGFYTHIRVDGVASSPETVLDFHPTIRDDIVLYSFYVPLPAPVDPTRQSVDVAFFDETYYTDLYTEDSWIAVSGDQTTGCVPTLRQDNESPFYFGMVFPQRIGLRCAEG